MKQNSVESGFINAGSAAWIPPTTTFASAPQSPATGSVYLFTDALTPGAIVGGGTSLSTCRWSGTAWVSASAGPPVTIQDEGTPLTQRASLNFVGTGVVATDDAANGRTVVTIAGGTNLVTSVFTRTGAVVAASGDYTVAQVTGAVPDTRQVIAGTGMTGGGALSANVTLNANISGIQTPWLSNINAAGFSLSSIPVISLSPGGQLSAIAGLVTLSASGASQSLSASATSSLQFSSGVETSFYTGSSPSAERMRITTAGSIGVGNAAAVLPSSSNAGYFNLLLGSQTAGTLGSLSLCSKTNTLPDTVGQVVFVNYQIASTDKRIATINGNAEGSADSGVLVFYTWNAGVVGERMRITAADVGINGAPAGSARLTVHGPSGGASVRATDDVNSTVVLSHPSSGVAQIAVPSGILALGSDTVLLRLGASGTIVQMYLGGSLKTLSVDGSGFVKAA